MKGCSECYYDQSPSSETFITASLTTKWRLVFELAPSTGPHIINVDRGAMTVAAAPDHAAQLRVQRPRNADIESQSSRVLFALCTVHHN